MAAGNIKGITIEIGGDTTKLSKALSGVNSSCSSLQKELREVDKLLKLDPSNTELLAQKQKILKEAIGSTKEKLDTLKEAEKQVQEQFENGEVSEEQYRALQREIASTEIKLGDLEQQAKESNKELEGVADAADDTAEKVSKIDAAASALDTVSNKAGAAAKALAPLSAGAAAVGAASYAAAMDIDNGYDIVITKTGATGEALESLQGSMENIFTNLPIDAETAGTAIGEVNTRFQLTGEELEKLSQQFIEFSEINDTDLNTSIDNVDTILNKFNVDASQAGNVLGLLTKTGQDTGLSMDTLENSLMQNGSTLKEMGLGITESANLLAAFENNGVDATTAMAGLKKSVKNYTAEGLSTNEALQKTIDRIKNASTETEALSIAQETFGSKGFAEMAQAIREGKLSLEKDFTTNGIGFLTDAVSCIVTEERNGIYELALTYPTKGHLAKYLENDAIIKAKANDEDNPQLFRIYNHTKAVGENTTWYGEHISYELNGNPVDCFTVSEVNGERALHELLDAAILPHEFTCASDITTTNSTSIDGAVSVRNAMGGTEGSLLDVWGGEYHYDNYRVELLKARGVDNGVTIEYGKNLIDAKQEKNIADVVTVIFPYAKYTAEGAEQKTYITLPEKVLQHENANKYATLRCEIVDFSGEWESGTIITTDMLRAKAKEYLGKLSTEPKVNITLSFASLKKTKDYKNIKAFESVKLCDIVTVKILPLDINVKAKITKVKYDSIKERYESLEIGAARTNLTKTITAAQKEAQELIVKNQTRAEQIKKQIENTIKNVTAAITGNSGGYVVLHPEKNPQEIFILDTPDMSKAKNVWRWNLAGLGHSSTGVNGEFTTAITADGQIVADFITAGELTGAILKAGTVYAEALDVEYRNKVTKHATDAAEAALNSAKQYANGLQESTNKEIQDVNNAIDDINNELETTVADGIITESEKAAIQKMLQIIVKEKEEADAKHEELFDNDYVPSAELNAMHKAWLTVFGTANTAKYNVLVTAINNVINSETKEEIEKNMETYRTAYSEYGSAVTEYQTAVSIAIEAAANAYAAEKANSVGETVTKEMTAKIESTASEITLLCKTIEEHNMHNYVAGGDFKDGFTDEWYTSSENNEVITDSTLGVCAKILKTSSTSSYIRCKIGVLPAGTYRVRYKAATASGSESNARVQCTFYTTQTTAYGLLKSTEWTTVEREVTLPESTSTRYLYLYAYTQGAAVYVKDIEVLGQMAVYTEAQLKINSDSITQEVKRAKGIEDELKASIKVNAENITSCVTKGNVGSYITQYYNNVIVAFNNSSKYVQINAGEIAIYDYGVSASKKRAVFDEQGNHFYRDNYYVGKIGTNQWVDNNAHKGLVFDLETQGKYMAWAQKPTEGASSYTTILCYSRANSIFTQVGLHLGCNMYGHGWILDGVDLRNCNANGYTTFTGTLPVVLEIHKTDNNGGIGWTYGNVYIKNGLITSIPT